MKNGRPRAGALRLFLTASSVSTLAVCATTSAATAQIGLSHAERGTTYLSIESGYQSGTRGVVAAPSAGASNVLDPGVQASGRAFSGPLGSYASTTLVQPGVTGSVVGAVTLNSTAGTSTLEIVPLPPGGSTVLSAQTSGTPPDYVSSASASASGGVPTALGSAIAAPGAGAIVTAISIADGSTAITQGVTSPAGHNTFALISTPQNSLFASTSWSPGVGASAVVSAASFTSVQVWQGYSNSPSGEALETASEGAFGGASLGYVLPVRAFGFLDRIEAYASRATRETQSNSSGFGFTTTSADGSVAYAAFDTAGLANLTTVTESRQDYGLRFKSDNATASAVPVIVSFEPFYRRSRGEARSYVGGDYALGSTVEASFYGAQVAVETEVAIATYLSMVGRIAGGVYGVSVDGRANERIAIYEFARSAGTDGAGYRVGAEAGLRLALGPTSYATLTGAVDHLSKAPSLTGGTFGSDFYRMGQFTDYQVKLNVTFKAAR